MYSVECFRQFLSERLTVAAEEIFRVFEKTVVQYEEEILRQRRLVGLMCQPQVKIHRMGLPVHQAEEEETLKEEEEGEKEIFSVHQLTDQERNSSLDHKDPQLHQIKEEEEDLCISQEGEQSASMHETNVFKMTSTCSDDNYSEDQDLDLNPDESERTAGQDSISTAAFNTTMSDFPCKTHAVVKPFRCETCGKVFTCKSKLITHLRIHTGAKPFPCNICGKAFNQASTLKVHKRLHTGEKPHSCHVCGLTFNQKSTLEVHTRVHTGERPYSCNICGKTFNRTSRLTVHRRIHTGEKPYSCHTCGISFKDKPMLKRHIRAHTGDKPFLCPICGQRFFEKSSLRYHANIHTGEKPYPCEMCGKGFRSRGSLSTHMKTHTGFMSM